MNKTSLANHTTTKAPETSPLSPDQRHLHGPFDIIGDVHGCHEELRTILRDLGYQIGGPGDELNAEKVCTPPGRTVIFVGDLVDRGANSMTAVKIVMAMIEAGAAYCVMGNHDDKFWRWLRGRDVAMKHGLEATIADFTREPPELKDQLLAFFAAMPHHLWLDGGRLAVAHAGVQPSMLGKTSADVRRFCLYGDTEPARDGSGLPTRYHWAAGYRGETTIVYGHTPLAHLGWVNNTLCIDTGCCFGGALTALRWPERDLISVEANEEYTQRLRPFGHPPIRPQRVMR